MKKFISFLLLIVMVLALAACGGGNTAGGDDAVDVAYEADIVKQQLAEVLEIEESEISMEDVDNGTVMSYGDWDTWFDCYIVNDSKDAPEYFEFQTLVADFEDKRVDDKSHKIWVVENPGNEGDSNSYTVLAMKGNLVLSVTSYVEPEVFIDTLDLD